MKKDKEGQRVKEGQKGGKSIDGETGITKTL